MSKINIKTSGCYFQCLKIEKDKSNSDGLMLPVLNNMDVNS
jgi:hypothetical protein